MPRYVKISDVLKQGESERIGEACWRFRCRRRLSLGSLTTWDKPVGPRSSCIAATDESDTKGPRGATKKKSSSILERNAIFEKWRVYRSTLASDSTKALLVKGGSVVIWIRRHRSGSGQEQTPTTRRFSILVPHNPEVFYRHPQCHGQNRSHIEVHVRGQWKRVPRKRRK